MLTIHKEIELKATPDKVFDALTVPEHILGYYPLNSVTSAGEVGGEIRFHGEVAGAAFTDYGVIETLRRPRCFKYRYWSDNHGTVDSPENRMTIEYRLQAFGGHTLLAIDHSNLLTAERQLMMLGVWDMLLSALKDYVEQDGVD